MNVHTDISALHLIGNLSVMKICHTEEMHPRVSVSKCKETNLRVRKGGRKVNYVIEKRQGQGKETKVS